MDYRKRYEQWLKADSFDEETRRELAALTSEEEIRDRFFRDLSFGTGGMRGVIGAGTNRMNRYTVGRASQGLANYLNKTYQNPSVVIAYDSRNKSSEFALDSALILAANGVKAYLFESLRPTPELSFSVRYLGASAGIVVTASHNPPSYNGYKVYSRSGGQIVPPEDAKIVESIASVKDFSLICRISKEEALSSGLLEYLGEETDAAYLRAVKQLLFDPEDAAREGKELKIVYTPLNGAGNVPVRRILRECGFSNVFVVPEQERPDGNFPTLKYPNPEDKAAFALALALAREKDADLVLATDPDADRLGVYAKERDGTYFCFTGNMSGILIADYLLSRKKEKGLLPKENRGALVTTIVSTDLAKSLAKEYGLTLFEVLTGFKYIGEMMRRFEEKGDYVFEFGFEESYGCLAGNHAHDKDAVAAVLLLCEAAAYFRARGLTLPDRMRQIYQKHGWFCEGLYSLTLEGEAGAKRIEEIMASFRKNLPTCFCGERVEAVRDYLSGERTEAKSGDKQRLTLEKSDVLYFELEHDSWVCVRPSGTEPKIKFYYGVKAPTEKEAKIKLQKIEAEISALQEGRQ